MTAFSLEKRRLGLVLAQLMCSTPHTGAATGAISMQSEPPRLLVVDDDRAVLTLVGTGVSCLDVLRALRTLRPGCEAVLTTGYTSLHAAMDALKENGDAPGAPAGNGNGHGSGPDRTPSEIPAP